MPKYLTTGQAAKLCAVTPDTVLKWIRSGQLKALRTAGGHHRIERADLEDLIPKPPPPAPELLPIATTSAAEPFAAASAMQPAAAPRQFRYCWEYKGGGRLLDACKQCVVYEFRAQRCYEIIKHAKDLGHAGQFCNGTCMTCDYYQLVQGQPTNVLVLTDNTNLVSTLRRDIDAANFKLEFTDCEYKCSSLVETFRPDYAVVDCSLGAQFTTDICGHLSEDPRIPYVRIILAGNEGEFPGDCDKQVLARINRPFSVRDLNDYTSLALLGEGADEN